MNKTMQELAAIAIFAMATATPALANSSRDVIITEARADAANTVLQVNGANFSGGTPRLTLGNVATPLTVTLVTPTQIEAQLPAGIAPGSYLLTLTIDRKQNKSGDDEQARGDEFWVTLGATGPQGAVGPAGPNGAAGAQGPVGASGAQGPAGATGAQGPAGATGAQGPAGVTGAQGPAGPQGIPGPAGTNGAPGPQGAPGTAGTLTSVTVHAVRDHQPGDLVGGLVEVVATCPAGTIFASGYSNFTSEYLNVAGNAQNGGWRAYSYTPLIIIGTEFIEAYATCLRFQ
jgi:hypothetical protein